MRLLSWSAGLCTPGVSTRTIWAAGCLPVRLRLTMPVMRLRVVCALWVTMASLSPVSELSRVDLPALGRPRMVTNPERTDRCYSTGPVFGTDFGGADFGETDSGADCVEAEELDATESAGAAPCGAELGGVCAAEAADLARMRTFSTRRAVDSRTSKPSPPSCTHSPGRGMCPAISVTRPPTVVACHSSERRTGKSSSRRLVSKPPGT